MKQNVSVFDVGFGGVCVCVWEQRRKLRHPFKVIQQLGKKGHCVGTLTDDTNLVGNMFPCIYRVLFISKLLKDPEKESAAGKMTRIMNATHVCLQCIF